MYISLILIDIAIFIQWFVSYIIHVTFTIAFIARLNDMTILFTYSPIL